MLKKLKSQLTSTRILALGFAGIIILGAFLLSLPIASKDGQWTSFVDTLFTATSATAVTGLVVFDTYLHWSIFGQIVILCLLQIGGIGFMTVVTLFSLFLKRNIGLHERQLLSQAAGAIRIGGIVKLIRRITLGTFIFEGVGTIFLATRFCPEMGLWKGIYNAIFHSVSAYCNAGFDLMGKFGEFSSLTKYSNDIIVNLTVMLLIVIGGVGFIVWNDIARHGLRFKKYLLHTKIVLTATFVLIFGGAILFFVFEGTSSMANESVGNKVLMSFFQSVTTRTAGFNTIDVASLSESGNLLTRILMFIGGSPGSTAGGIKTTTFFVLIFGAIASARQAPHINIFKKKIEDSVVKQATAIFTIYLIGILTATIIICAMQPFSVKQVMFETISAAGTVGLSTGITPSLNIAAKLIITFLMYGGRIGGLAIALVFAEKRVHVPIERPSEKIIIG